MQLNPQLNSQSVRKQESTESYLQRKEITYCPPDAMTTKGVLMQIMEEIVYFSGGREQ